MAQTKEALAMQGRNKMFTGRSYGEWYCRWNFKQEPGPSDITSWIFISMGIPWCRNVRLCLHTALLGEILAVSISEIQSYSHINGAIVVLKAHSSNTIGCRKSPGIWRRKLTDYWLRLGDSSSGWWSLGNALSKLRAGLSSGAKWLLCLAGGIHGLTSQVFGVSLESIHCLQPWFFPFLPPTLSPSLSVSPLPLLPTPSLSPPSRHPSLSVAAPYGYPPTTYAPYYPPHYSLGKHHSFSVAVYQTHGDKPVTLQTCILAIQYDVSFIWPCIDGLTWQPWAGQATCPLWTDLILHCLPLVTDLLVLQHEKMSDKILSQLW